MPPVWQKRCSRHERIAATLACQPWPELPGPAHFSAPEKGITDENSHRLAHLITCSRSLAISATTAGMLKLFDTVHLGDPGCYPRVVELMHVSPGLIPGALRLEAMTWRDARRPLFFQPPGDLEALDFRLRRNGVWPAGSTWRYVREI